MFWPNFLKSAEEKKEDRTNDLRDYQDYLNAGFHTLDMEEDYECSRKYKNGWWFPHRLKNERYAEDVNQTGNCHFNPNVDTNLLGEYNEEKDKNRRQISFCEKEDCFLRGPPFWNSGNWKGYYDLTDLTSIKLKKTQMWIGGKEDGL